MSELYTDVGYVSMNKAGEQLCGDHVEIASQNENSTVVVLADGLGSGVKASILSTLTSKIISTMMANGMSLENCVKTIAETLPVCSQRNVAYSTFSIIRIIDNVEAEIIQYDNPHVIMLREGKNYEYPKSSETIDGKIIYKSILLLREGDVFVAVSDGALHAGPEPILNMAWQRSDVIDFLETVANPDFTAKTLSTMLLNECYSLYGGEPGDDTTVCTVKIRRRKLVNLLIGPPASSEDVPKMMSLFFSKEGKHVVCGGTTSELAAEYHNQRLDTSPTLYGDPEIPPMAKMTGVDLVTEGAVTIGRVLEYARDYLKDNERYKDWSYKKDGASLLAKLLFEEATDINLFVGRAINPAHKDLPFGAGSKLHKVDELSNCLSGMGKRVKVSYF